jgi:hypothetical protein
MAADDVPELKHEGSSFVYRGLLVSGKSGLSRPSASPTSHRELNAPPKGASPGQLAGRGGSRSRLDEAKGRRATAPSADTDTAHARALHTQAVWSHAASFSWCRSTMPSLELSCHFMSARRGQSAGPISNL